MIVLDEVLRSCQDIVALSAIAVTVLWGAKLVRPSSDLERLCVPASALAMLVTLSAQVFALSRAGAIVPWAIVLLGPQVILTGITFEFGSRLWTLVPAILAPCVLFLLGGQPLIPVGFPPDWATVGAAGAWCGTGFLLAAAAAIPIQAIFGSPRTVTSRRTLRTLGASWGGLAEVTYRMVAWSLPFLVLTASVAASHLALVQEAPLRWLATGGLILGAVSYLLASRRVGDDPGHHPVPLLLLASGGVWWLMAWG